MEALLREWIPVQIERESEDLNSPRVEKPMAHRALGKGMAKSQSHPGNKPKNAHRAEQPARRLPCHTQHRAGNEHQPDSPHPSAQPSNPAKPGFDGWVMVMRVRIHASRPLRRDVQFEYNGAQSEFLITVRHSIKAGAV